MIRIKNIMLLHCKLTLYIVCLILLSGISSCTYVDENDLKGTDSVIFENVTEAAGLNLIKDSYAHCWGDINSEGLQDIFIVNHITPPLLFRNKGDGTFSEITSSSGMSKGGDLHGCAIADYDNDGDQDIYITSGAGAGTGLGSNRLYQNRGQNKFMDVALKAGVADPKGRGRSTSWVDYDNDGFLDLFITNDKRSDAPTVLFRNNGDGTFSKAPGIAIVDHVIETSWTDHDNDGFMDLTIAIHKKHLKGEIINYKNMGDGTFRKSRAFSGMSYVWGDYDNDGDMDLLTINPPRVHILSYEIDILSKFFKGFIRLYENRGDNLFVEVSEETGFKNKMGGEKAIFFDYDNDGDLDIYLLVSGTKNSNINDMIFRNNGDKTYTNVTKAIGLSQSFSGRGSGVAFSDYNNDGFLDLFLTNGKGREPYVQGKEPGPYILYKNRGNDNHWLKLELLGTKSNRDGIGARIKLHVRNQLQYRQNNGGMEGYIQNSSIIHFGLGKATSVDKIEVLWPSGSVTHLSNINADQLLIITEGQ